MNKLLLLALLAALNGRLTADTPEAPTPPDAAAVKNAAAHAAPQDPGAPMPPAEPAAPGAPGQVPSLAAPAGDSAPGTAQDAGALSPSAGPDEAAVEDADASPESATALATPDLAGVSTTVLARISAGPLGGKASVIFDPEQQALLEEPAAGAWKVDVAALYAELAHRMIFSEDKEARQALSLAILGGDERAGQAKDEAFDDRRTQSFIALATKGDAKALDSLKRLAENGSARAKAWLASGSGIPQGGPSVLSQGATSATAEAAPGPAALSATAGAPAALSGAGTASEPASVSAAASASASAGPAVPAPAGTTGTAAEAPLNPAAARGPEKP